MPSPTSSPIAQLVEKTLYDDQVRSVTIDLLRTRCRKIRSLLSVLGRNNDNLDTNHVDGLEAQLESLVREVHSALCEAESGLNEVVDLLHESIIMAEDSPTSGSDETDQSEESPLVDEVDKHGEALGDGSESYDSRLDEDNEYEQEVSDESSDHGEDDYEPDSDSTNYSSVNMSDVSDEEEEDDFEAGSFTGKDDTNGGSSEDNNYAVDNSRDVKLEDDVAAAEIHGMDRPLNHPLSSNTSSLGPKPCDLRGMKRQRTPTSSDTEAAEDNAIKTHKTKRSKQTSN